MFSWIHSKWLNTLWRLGRWRTRCAISKGRGWQTSSVKWHLYQHMATRSLSQLPSPAAIDSTSMSGHARVPRQLYLWTLKIEFHVSFMICHDICHDISFFFWFFQSCKNVKTLLISWAIQEQGAGWIWPGSSILPTLVLGQRKACWWLPFPGNLPWRITESLATCFVHSVPLATYMKPPLYPCLPGKVLRASCRSAEK